MFEVEFNLGPVKVFRVEHEELQALKRNLSNLMSPPFAAGFAYGLAEIRYAVVVHLKEGVRGVDELILNDRVTSLR
jgi:hypothetical protein